MALPSITQNPVRYGKVSWTALAALVDSLVDPDDYPNEVAVEGLIIFKPSTSLVTYTSAVPKYTRILANRQVNLVDAQIDEQGRKYVKLEANVLGANPAVLTWTATFVIGYAGVMVRLPDAKFTLSPDQEIDLTDYIDPGSTVTTIPGVTISALQQMIAEYGSDFVTNTNLTSEIEAHITSADLLSKPDADSYYAPAAGLARELNQRAGNFLGILSRARREHPPGITLGAETSSPTTTGGSAWYDGDQFIATIGKASPNVRPGSVIEPSVGGYAHYAKATGITGSAVGGSTYVLDFDYDGLKFDLGMVMAYQALTWFEVWVDGYLCASYGGTTATDGHNGFFQVSFPDARRRNIRLVRGNNWTNWLIPDSVGKFYYPRTSPVGPYTMIAGDSFTEGTGATATSSAGYVDLLPIMLGWNGIEGSGLGGTGYINVPSGSGKTNLRTRIATDIVPKAPDLCVIAMGYNDVDGVNTNGQIVTAATNTWSQVTSAGIALIVVGPWDSPLLTNTTQRAALASADAALKAAANSASVHYISPWDEAWFGGASTYLSGDNVHPNDAGHKRIASMLAAHLAA